MNVRLYSLSVSNAGHAALAMMRLKGIEPKVINLWPGTHRRIVRLLRFPGETVPAIKLDGRRLQGTREIARELDRLIPAPPLFPADPAARGAVEEAEAWADEELQNTPRRIMRLSGVRSQAFRRWIAKETLGLPLPGLVAALGITETRALAKASEADEPMVRRELRELPAKVERIDGLIADGVIAAERPNAADFQIASSVRLMLMLEGLRDVIAGSAAESHARALFREPFGGAEPIPWVLPDEWLARPGG